MKLATLPSSNPKNRNGTLCVVSQDNRFAVKVEPEISLLTALQSWHEIRPSLKTTYESLNSQKAPNSFALDLKKCLAPIPDAPGFYDGSAFLSHVVRARKARGDEMPASARITPLMYQGVSDHLLPAFSDLELMDPAFGGDFEGEFAAIVDEIPKGTPANELSGHIVLLMLFNDITYREIVKTEIETKFGFLQSKPNSAFAPLVVTPDEAGAAWDGQRLNLDLEVKLNNQWFGNPNGSEMHFTFPQLIAHAGRTRPLSAGSIIGTGTVSNEDKGRGFTCLTEKRFQEILEDGKPSTPWLKPGDVVSMDVHWENRSLFGPIEQTVR